MAGLDDFPTLKVYHLTGPARFSVQPLVCVRIQDTKDTYGEGREGLASRFMAWCNESKTCEVRFASSGGGAVEVYFDPKDAEKIRTWLLEQGGQDETMV